MVWITTVAIALTLLGAHGAAAATYYVSSAGNDARAGTSSSTAWRTIGRVNNHTFAPGDQILFQGGKTFTGNLYFDAADAGTASAPVTVSSYGTGRATLYAANGRGMLGYNTAGFRVRNLNLVGSGRDLNVESGILFYNDLPGDVLLDFVHIDSVDITRFGDYGIEIGGWAGRSGFRNVRIMSVVASENGLGGIFTFAQQRAVHRNVYVGYSQASQNLGFAGLAFNSGNGIALSGVDGGMIERSVAHTNGERSTAGNGPVGIWTFESNNVTIQYSESFNNRTGNTKDGGGFHLDNSTSNSVLQYNYSHGNAGAGFMLAHKYADNVHTGNVVRYNVSQNDGRKNNYAAIQLWGRIRNAQIHNNTAYVTYASGATRVLHARNNSIESNDLENVYVRNNIFQSTGGVPLVDFTSTVLDTARGVRLEGNAYWSTGGAFKILWKGTTYTSLEAFRSASAQERLNGADVGVVASPDFEAPGRGVTFNNARLLGGLWEYRLKVTSPLLDKGLNLAALGVAIGPRDYFGGASKYHLGYDIGAHEFDTSCHWAVSPASVSLSAAGGTRTVAVYAATSTCGWAVMPSVTWLTVSREYGTGQADVPFTVAANPGTTARTGSIRIGNQTVVVTQGAP